VIDQHIILLMVLSFLDNQVDMFMSNKLKLISSKEFINHVLDNQAIYVTHAGRYPHIICVTPTFYKNKVFVQIGVHIKL
jgi:hypothetical protein